MTDASLPKSRADLADVRCCQSDSKFSVLKSTTETAKKGSWIDSMRSADESSASCLPSCQVKINWLIIAQPTEFVFAREDTSFGRGRLRLTSRGKLSSHALLWFYAVHEPVQTVLPFKHVCEVFAKTVQQSKLGQDEPFSSGEICCNYKNTWGTDIKMRE